MIELRLALISYQDYHILLSISQAVDVRPQATGPGRVPRCLYDMRQRKPVQPPPSPNFVPGLQHAIVIEWMQALFLYQDYRM